MRCQDRFTALSKAQLLIRFVTGLEFAGRFGAEVGTRSGVFVERFAFATVTNNEFQQMGTSASLHAALRAGAAIGNTLLFVKAGAGGTEISTIRRSDIQVQFCATIATINGVPTCTSFGGVGATSTFSRSFSQWHPSAVAGGGLEYDHRRLFLRLEAEGEAVFDNTYRRDVFWIARTKPMVGVRF